MVQKASRQNKEVEFATQLKQTAQRSVGLDDRCLEVELRIMMRQFMAIAESIREIEQEIRHYTALVLAGYSARLKLDEPLTASWSIGLILEPFIRRVKQTMQCRECYLITRFHNITFDLATCF